MKFAKPSLERARHNKTLQRQVRRQRCERGVCAGGSGPQEEEGADEDGLAADIDGSCRGRDNCQGQLLVCFLFLQSSSVRNISYGVLKFCSFHNPEIDQISRKILTKAVHHRNRSRRNTSEGLRRKPSGKGRAGTTAQQKQEAAVVGGGGEDSEDPVDPRRPSVEDLALTENLIPEEQGAFQGRYSVLS